LSPAAQHAEGVARLGRAATAIAVTGGMIWVLRRNGRLYGLDPASGEVAMEGKVPRGAGHMIAHDGMLWVSCARDRRVVCFDPGIGRIGAEIQLPQRIKCLALAGDALLVGCARSFSKRGRLRTIDCADQRVVLTAGLPGQPRAIVGEDAMAWVACGSGLLGREGTIERVDLRRGEVIEWRATEWKVSDLALIDEGLLASMHLELAVPATDGGGGGA
jgi:streptogramin lyase